jgi:hypothetical protein
MVRLSAAKKTNRDAFTRIPASGAESLMNPFPSLPNYPFSANLPDNLELQEFSQ